MMMPPPLPEAPLLAGGACLDRPAVIGGAANWTWRQVHAASLTLAARLGEGGVFFNLCNSRAGFLIAWLALLRSRRLQCLPPSGGQADLDALLRSAVDPVIIVDDPQALRACWQARCVLHVPEPESVRMPQEDLAWSPDWDEPLVRLYTSGSTGAPVAQVKTLGQLIRGAQVLGMWLGGRMEGAMEAIRQIVCSVPPQHMFGLETSVMLPLVFGMPVLDRRPLLPADIHASFELCEAGTAWIATPLHLHALVQAGQALPNCGTVISSTMPLAKALSAQAEALTGAPVLEIYGSTETGAVAMRRTAHDVHWQPVCGVRLEPEADGTRAWGSHFSSPQTLNDRVALDAQGRFELLGRQGDLIKIAGRRASLAGLNLLLRDLPGLGDGVFHLPATGGLAERLVLIHAGAALDRQAAQAWLRARMDPVFLPRAFIHVDCLPRNDGGKLQRAALDRIYADWLAKKPARKGSR